MKGKEATLACSPRKATLLKTHTQDKQMTREQLSRAYGRMELAQLYSPDITPAAAWRRLSRWIKRNPELDKRINTMPQHNARVWTPAQVAAIVEALGEP